MRIKVQSIKFFLMGLLLIEPPFFMTIDAIDAIYDITLPVIFIYLIFVHIHLRLINRILLMQVAFFLTIAFPTIMRSGDVAALVITFTQVMALSMYVNYGCRVYGMRFLRVAGSVYFLYACLNLLSMIIMPNGVYAQELAEHSWVLGHKNTMIKYLFPGFYMIGLASLVKEHRFDLPSRLYLIIIIATTLIGGSSTSLIALVVLGLCFFIRSKNWNAVKIVNFYMPLIYNACFFLLIVVFRIQDHFAYLIENILGKQLNLTGRTYLWDKILAFIAMKPMNGYGLETQNVIQQRLEYWNISAHNIVADYLYEGGLCCIIALVIIFVITKRNLDKMDKRWAYAYFFNNALFLSFSIVWSTDTFIKANIQGIFVILTVAYHLCEMIPDVDQEGREVKNDIIRK